MSSPTFSPPMIRLLDLMESNLHYIVRVEMNREQALEMKRRMLLPIGILNKLHKLNSESAAKDIIRKNHVFVDSST